MNIDVARVRELNDRLRKTHRGGRILLTCGIIDLGPEGILAAVEAVTDFDDFSPGNDPYHEHDFGAVMVMDRQVFWKIEYYAPGLESASLDPSDEANCVRVLTVMLAEEY